MAKNYYPEFCVDDATADVIIEKGRYWDDKTTFFSYKLTSGYDPNHYFSFDVNRGSESSGWTLFSTPGTFQVKAGKKHQKNPLRLIFLQIMETLALLA